MWGMLAATGLVSDGSQPNMACAWPLKNLEKLEEADELTELHFAQVMEMKADPKWEIVSSFTDTDGDMKLWTKPQIGRYHFVGVTMTLKNTTCEQVLDFALSEELDTRKEFSHSLEKLDILAKTEKTSLQHTIYGAPTGVAPREFIMLAGQKELEDGVMVGYGCSVDSPKIAEQSTPVRGAAQFMWHLTQAGDNVLVCYRNCFDPRGWTPSFLLAWLKGTATQEFINIRAVMAGKKAEVKEVTAADLGISEEDIKKEKEAAKQ